MNKIETNKKIAFVFSYFSYFRGFSSIRELFSQKCEISFFHYKINPSKTYYNRDKLDPEFKINYINNFGELNQFDIIFLGFGGEDLENSIKEINSIDRKIITFFPGVRKSFDYNGLLSRCSSDIILFNNKNDLMDYQQLGNDLNIDTSNGLLFGFPNLISRTDFTKKNNLDKLCFIAQSEILTKAEKLYLLEKFLNFCNQNPEKELTIVEKSRSNIKDAHSDDHNYDKLLKLVKNKPSNLKISFDKIENILSNHGVIFSISSSIVLESLKLGIKTALISDLKISDQLGNICFMNSGLFMSLDDILSGKDNDINQTWLNNYIVDPSDNIQEFNHSLNKPKNQLFNKEYFLTKLEINEILKAKKIDEIRNLNFFIKSKKRIKKLFKNPSLYLKDSQFSFLNKIGKIIYGR